MVVQILQRTLLKQLILLNISLQVQQHFQPPIYISQHWQHGQVIASYLKHGKNTFLSFLLSLISEAI